MCRWEEGCVGGRRDVGGWEEGYASGRRDVGGWEGLVGRGREVWKGKGRDV